MTNNEGEKVRLAVALALPDEGQFRRDIQAINKFQQIVHATMIRDLDYGVIPGTQKPTLLKPGAEKIAKLLGLADQYEIMDKAEDWVKPFFRYLLKCKLIHVASGDVITEGLGECNSMEGKYRWRWVGDRDLPSGLDKTKLVTQERRNKSGGHWTVYRLDNEDIYSQVNTILKMAKKRALVDAALSAGRLSDVFTQDIEDIPGLAQPEDYTAESVAQRARKEPIASASLETDPAIAIPQPDTAKPAEGEALASNRLFTVIREHRPALKTDKNVIDWLTGPLRISADRIASEPDKVLEDVKQLNGWK